MLVLSRRKNESISIKPAIQAMDMTVSELFSAGPIILCVLSTGEYFARIGIEAPPKMKILREELQKK